MNISVVIANKERITEKKRVRLILIFFRSLRKIVYNFLCSHNRFLSILSHKEMRCRGPPTNVTQNNRSGESVIQGFSVYGCRGGSRRVIC